MGVDCSGLVQLLYRAIGIDLPRDAWQQAQEGSPVKKFREALPGDLLFFDAGEEIVHVGILMKDHKMLHSSGMVRIDAVDKKGIVYEKKVQRRLKLRAIRRVM
jgi:cell wall-associated NlpC family hydrolase